jgi:hypothetical protein
MSGDAVPLSVVPAALQGASGLISGQAAPLTTPSDGAPASMETAGKAGAAMDRALDGYCAAFAQRLSTVADGLSGVAGAYTATEAGNRQTVASVEV